MLRLFEVLTGIGAMLATTLLLASFASGMSAPQQGAAAAMALGFVVIPYCVLGMLQRKALLDRKPGLRLEPLDF